MVGGYNVNALIELLQSPDQEIANTAAKGLSKTLLVYDAVNDLIDLSSNNQFAKQVVESWAAAEWFTSKPSLAKEITLTVFKINGETNILDLHDLLSRGELKLGISSHILAHLRALVQSRRKPRGRCLNTGNRWQHL